MKKRKVRNLFIPTTVLGKWSVGLLIIFFLLFVLLQLLVFLGQRGGNTLTDNLFLAILGILMAISGIAAFFTGIISIIKSKERSILVFLATIIGFLILFFVAGEIMVPH
jgi:hypothetical protein